MPFSSGRSVRAPASKATRIVVARVPGSAMRCSGRPLGRVEVSIWGMASPNASRALQTALQAGVSAFVHSRAMALIEADARDVVAPRSAPPRDAVIEFRGVSKRYEGTDVGLHNATFTV